MSLHNAFFFLTLHRFLNQSITYSPLHSIVVGPFSLCWFQCHSFQRRWGTPTTTGYISSFDLPSYNTIENWKEDRLLVTYLWSKFHLPRNQETIWIDKVSEKYMWKSDIFSKNETRWSVYLLKTLLFRRCFSNILPAQINYLAPKRVKHMSTKVRT